MESRTTIIIIIFIFLLLISAVIGFIANQYIIASNCISDPNMKTAANISLFFPLSVSVIAFLFLGILLASNIESLRKL